MDKAKAEYDSTLSNVKGGITKNSRLDQKRLEEVLVSQIIFYYCIDPSSVHARTGAVARGS